MKSGVLIAALLVSFGMVTLASSAAAPTPTPYPSIPLPRNAVVSLSVVQRFFPGVTAEMRAGDDEAVTGTPIATRSVTFADASGTKNVTIAVEWFVDSRSANSAYREAVERRKSTIGFSALAIPKLGEETFAGAVTRGGSMRVELGVLTGIANVALTLDGFDAGARNVENLVAMSRRQLALVRDMLAASKAPVSATDCSVRDGPDGSVELIATLRNDSLKAVRQVGVLAGGVEFEYYLSTPLLPGKTVRNVLGTAYTDADNMRIACEMANAPTDCAELKRNGYRVSWPAGIPTLTPIDVRSRINRSAAEGCWARATVFTDGTGWSVSDL